MVCQTGDDIEWRGEEPIRSGQKTAGIASADLHLARSGSAGLSQANLDLAKKNRSALSLNSVGGRGVSCLWIGLLVFITSSCAGTEGRHTIPYPGLSVSRPSRLTQSSPEHQPASALEGAMEKHTRLIAPYPTDQWGLSLSENGSANLCETVLMYPKPCQVITMLILNMQVKKYKFTPKLDYIFKKPAKTQTVRMSECNNRVCATLEPP